MRTYDVRFPPRAPQALISELDDAGLSATASVRGIIFTKYGRRLWRNDFRAAMSSAEVASVLHGGDYTIAEPRTYNTMTVGGLMGCTFHSADDAAAYAEAVKRGYDVLDVTEGFGGALVTLVVA